MSATRRAVADVPALEPDVTRVVSPGNGGGVAWLVIALFLCAALKLPGLVEPWGADQSVFAFIARGVLEGAVPYRDLYSSTGYGIFFMYAALFRLFGESMLVLHLADLVAALAGVAGVWAGARWIAGWRAAAAAAVLQGFYGGGLSFSALYEMGTASGPYWALAQRESFMAPLLVGSLLLCLVAIDRSKRGRGDAIAWLSCGALVGLAVVFKYTAIVMIPALAVGAVLASGAGGGGEKHRALLRTVRAGALMLSGCAVAQLPFLAWFASKSAMGAMIHGVFLQSAAYAGLSRGARVETFVIGHGAMFAENLPVWLLATLAAGGLLRRRERGLGAVACLAAAAALASVWLQGKHFGYHFLVVFPFLSLLAGVGFEREILAGRRLGRAAREDLALPQTAAVWAVIALFPILFVGWNYPHLRWDVLRLTGRIDAGEHLERFNEYPQHFYSARANREVASHLGSTAKPGAALRTVNDGGELVIFHWTPLESPTRFTSSWYLFNSALMGNPVTRELRDEFIEETIRARPEYLLLVFYPLDDWPALYPLDRDPMLGRFYVYIRDEYRLERRFRDGRDLYRLR